MRQKEKKLDPQQLAEQQKRDAEFTQWCKDNNADPEDFDRWGTPPGVTKTISKNTPTQQKAIDEMNAEWDAQKRDAEISQWCQVNNTDPEDLDRWGTLPGVTKTISEPTPEQKALVAQINAQRQKEFETALAIAKKVKHQINYCYEYTNAYAFAYETGERHIGGDSPIVVMKGTGETMNFTAYAPTPCKEFIRDYEV